MTNRAQLTVYIAGVTGWTGTSVADALLERPEQYKVIAPVRPSSADKPIVASLRERGAEIHIVEIAALEHQKLVDELRGAQIVVSTLTAFETELQKTLAKASKDAGVVRFIPSDWGTACKPGVMQLHDMKLGMQEYVKELGLGYTFIDVGGWAESAFAFVSTDGLPYADLAKVTTAHWGTGDVKTALTNRSDIGQYVARILADERTLNQYVFIWAEEITLNEIIALAEKVTGRKLDLSHVSGEELEERIKSSEGLLVYAWQFMQSLWIRGDNTVANAKRPEYGGALDAQELYPDYKPRSLEPLLREFAARVEKN